MARRRKSAREKLEKDQEPRVVEDRRGRGMMLIPKPLDVDALMRQIEGGKLATANQIRDRLAKNFDADLT